jgi:hypothetical protein
MVELQEREVPTMKRFLLPLLLPLLSGCVGEETRAAFTLRPPSSAVQVYVADHSAEHERNLQKALDNAIRAQEAAEERESQAREKSNAVMAALPTAPCVVHDLDTDSCGDGQ